VDNTREIDKLIVEKIFSREVHSFTAGKNTYYVEVTGHDLLPYSTDMSAAWQILEFLDKSTQAFAVDVKQQYDGLWSCGFNGLGDEEFLGRAENEDTASMAICKAALSSKGVKI
jgi:hypothetical protein